ncbi:MAG TPA: hypothetical protein VE965_01090 [Gammaproteobacteria bacterium]|nr:hypothetical protein [Gammaproteobacteria bacterium]
MTLPPPISRDDVHDGQASFTPLQRMLEWQFFSTVIRFSARWYSMDIDGKRAVANNGG